MIHIVVGPPCAGKSTLVKNTAAPDTLRVDFDDIAVTLGAGSTHDSPPHIRGAAFAVRDAIIQHALKTPDEDAWIIHTRPTAEQIKTYTEHNATFHVVDPGKETCLTRSANDERPDRTAAAIEAWYDTPPAIPTDADTVKSHLARLRIAQLIEEAP